MDLESKTEPKFPNLIRDPNLDLVSSDKAKVNTNLNLKSGSQLENKTNGEQSWTWNSELDPEFKVNQNPKLDQIQVDNPSWETVTNHNTKTKSKSKKLEVI